MFIEDVLREELENSLVMKQNCERSLAALPKGSLVRRIIKGRPYHYLVFRENGRVRSVYKGKVSSEELVLNRRIKEQRAQYRQHLAELNRQVRFIRRALRGHESV